MHLESNPLLPGSLGSALADADPGEAALSGLSNRTDSGWCGQKVIEAHARDNFISRGIKRTSGTTTTTKTGNARKTSMRIRVKHSVPLPLELQLCQYMTVVLP